MSIAFLDCKFRARDSLDIAFRVQKNLRDNDSIISFNQIVGTNASTIRNLVAQIESLCLKRDVDVIFYYNDDVAYLYNWTLCLCNINSNTRNKLDDITVFIKKQSMKDYYLETAIYSALQDVHKVCTSAIARVSLYSGLIAEFCRNVDYYEEG